jgi:uncharacterized protein (DUF433 family)
MSTGDAWKERITLDPAVLAGKPTIRGLRISVEQILRTLAAGVPDEELLQDYPDPRCVALIALPGADSMGSS